MAGIFIAEDDKVTRDRLAALVDNALEFTEEGLIRIHPHSEGDFVILSVEDSGSEISKESRASVFMPCVIVPKFS